MKVYHTSPVIVENPDIAHSRDFLDFGSGFYVTTMLNQAQKYGDRFIRRGKDAILNIYELADDITAWKVIEFKHYDEAWLDFVTECRAGRTVGDYDVVIGGIANDKVFRTVDLYYAGEINKEECLRRLILRNPIIRFAFVHKECLMNV